MAIPDHIRAIFYGAATTTDVWNVGVNYSFPTSVPNLTTLAGDVISKFNSLFWSNASYGWKALQTADCNLQGVKLFSYTNGVLSDEATATITPVSGSNSGGSPSFTAACVTLQGSAFGKSHRGRLYLPYTGPCDGHGQMTLSQGYLTALGSFLSTHTFAGTDGTGMFPSIYSRKLGSMDSVAKIRLNTKPDTQRGRNTHQLPSGTWTTVLT